MDHKIILKCRVCLGEFDENSMYDLFQETAVNSDRSAKQRPLRLGEKVEYCCGVRIRESGEMPTKICMKCFDITRMWFNFRRICVNSQVYLESLCRDRKRPEGYDDGEYLEYLLEDVQTFREDARRTNAALAHSADELDSDAELSESEYEDGPDEDYMREAIAGSDSELKSVIKKIKKEENLETEMDEPADELEEKQTRGRMGWVQRKAAVSRGAAKSMKREAASTAKKTAHIGRKRGRAALPTSYMCSICGNVYTKRASFAYHMSLHSNVKPHECELCGKGFRQVCELKNHMRRHTGEKPYKCSYCDRHFIDRSEKHRHERVHTNTRPYSCNVCGKSFMYSAILKNHSKLHSGEKEFNCLVCQKAFTLQHQLKAHLQTITHKQKEAQFVSAGYEVVYE